MTEKLKEVEQKYLDLEKKLEDPSVISDVEQYKKISKEYKSLTPLMEKYRESVTATKELEDIELMLSENPDPEMRQMCTEEKAELSERLQRINEEIKILLMVSELIKLKN